MSVSPSLRVEEALNAGYESEGIREAELVTACARENGLDGYTQLFDPPPLNPILLEGEETMSGREYAETYGTGAIAKNRIRIERMEEGGEFVEPQLSEDEEQILYYGPVVTPEGQEFGGGCAQWGRERASNSGLIDQRDALGEVYAQAIEDDYYGSAEYLALEDEFAACMAGEGFPGMSGTRSVAGASAGMIDAYLADPSTYDEAFQADRALGLASYECSSPLGDDRDTLRSNVDAAFYEAHESEVEALRWND